MKKIIFFSPRSNKLNTTNLTVTSIKKTTGPVRCVAHWTSGVEFNFFERGIKNINLSIKTKHWSSEVRSSLDQRFWLPNGASYNSKIGCSQFIKAEAKNIIHFKFCYAVPLRFVLSPGLPP